jgi:hypothetical protein
MLQYRILDNKIYPQQDVELVGFSKNQDYPVLENPEKVLIFRTALGVGDWVMLERLPAAIKKYYPKCEVYLPSPKMIAETFGPLMYQWASWGDVSKTVELVFKNNPYVDGYVDTWEGEVYSDHWRIFDETNWKTPLVRQMARFYNIDDDKELDYTPMIYFSEDDIRTGITNINELSGQHTDYNFIHISNRNTGDDNKILLDYIKKNKLDELPFLYYYKGDIQETIFKELRLLNNIENIKDIRSQFFIKSKAKNCIGNQTGAMDVVCGLTKVHALHHSETLYETFRVGNYLPPQSYIKRAQDEQN